MINNFYPPSTEKSYSYCRQAYVIYYEHFVLNESCTIMDAIKRTGFRRHKYCFVRRKRLGRNIRKRVSTPVFPCGIV